MFARSNYFSGLRQLCFPLALCCYAFFCVRASVTPLSLAAFVLIALSPVVANNLLQVSVTGTWKSSFDSLLCGVGVALLAQGFCAPAALLAISLFGVLVRSFLPEKTQAMFPAILFSGALFFLVYPSFPAPSSYVWATDKLVVDATFIAALFLLLGGGREKTFFILTIIVVLAICSSLFVWLYPSDIPARDSFFLLLCSPVHVLFVMALSRSSAVPKRLTTQYLLAGYVTAVSFFLSYFLFGSGVFFYLALTLLLYFAWSAQADFVPSFGHFLKSTAFSVVSFALCALLYLRGNKEEAVFPSFSASVLEEMTRPALPKEVHTFNPSVHRETLEKSLFARGTTLALSDLDRNGLLDIVAISPRAEKLNQLRIYINQGAAQFERVQPFRLAAALDEQNVPNLRILGASLFDFSGDGYTDIFLHAAFAPPILLQNSFMIGGSVDFMPYVTKNKITQKFFTYASVVEDFNADGQLDILLTNYLNARAWLSYSEQESRSAQRVDSADWLAVLQGKSRIFLAAEDGFYTQKSLKENFLLEGRISGGLSADFNQDTATDIYLSEGTTSDIYVAQKNRGYRALPFGATKAFAPLAVRSQAAGLGDFNADGLLDVFSVSLQGAALWLNRGYQNSVAGVHFVESAYTANATVSSDTFGGVAVGDLDADGAVDILVAGQVLWNKGKYFSSLNIDLDIAEDAFSSYALGDVDNDGDLDIFVLNDRGGLMLYENKKNPAHWIGLALRGNGKSCNSDAHGSVATVVLHHESGTTQIEREVRLKRNSQSQSDSRILIQSELFDSAEEISLTVSWCKQNMVSQHYDLAKNSYNRITQE